MKANTEKQEDNEESPKIVSRNTDPVYQKDFEDSSQKKEHSQNNLNVNQNFQILTMKENFVSFSLFDKRHYNIASALFKFKKTNIVNISLRNPIWKSTLLNSIHPNDFELVEPELINKIKVIRLKNFKITSCQNLPNDIKKRPK